MHEIDCSELPDELVSVAFEAAEETIEETPYDTNGIKLMRNANLITLNGEGRQTLRVYGQLRQAMVAAVQKHLGDNYSNYTENEYEQYRHGIEFRKV